MNKWIYPKFLSHEQIDALRAAFPSAYRLSQVAHTNCFYTNMHLDRNRKVFRHSITKYALALGMTTEEFEDLEKLPI